MLSTKRLLKAGRIDGHKKACIKSGRVVNSTEWPSGPDKGEGEHALPHVTGHTTIALAMTVLRRFELTGPGRG